MRGEKISQSQGRTEEAGKGKGKTSERPALSRESTPPVLGIDTLRSNAQGTLRGVGGVKLVSGDSALVESCRIGLHLKEDENQEGSDPRRQLKNGGAVRFALTRGANP